MKSYICALLISAASADVVMHCGGWAGEVRWRALNSAGSEICKSVPYPRSRQQYPSHCELPVGETITFECTDTYGDGWNGGFLMVGDIPVCKGFRSGRQKIEEIRTPFETFDSQSTGGFSGSVWHQYNNAPEPQASLTRGVSDLGW